MVLRFGPFIFSGILLFSCSSGETKNADTEISNVDVISVGEGLYAKHCASCHGSEGDLGSSGAKDLKSSMLPDSEIKRQINDGKGAMPPLKAVIDSDEDIDSIIVYIKTFRR